MHRPFLRTARFTITERFDDPGSSLPQVPGPRFPVHRFPLALAPLLRLPLPERHGLRLDALLRDHRPACPEAGGSAGRVADHDAWLSSLRRLLLLAGAVLVSGRWFCRYLCPLGAAYGLFNYVSPLRVVHDEAACSGCGKCEGLCPMDVKKERNSFLDVTGCIKCGRCVKACGTGHGVFLPRSGFLPNRKMQRRLGNNIITSRCRAPNAIRICDKFEERDGDSGLVIQALRLPGSPLSSPSLRPSHPAPPLPWRCRPPAG